MTVWITGANGFIARHLARELADRGLTVDGIGYGAPQDADKKKWGYRTCLNGEVNASNLHALASSTGLPSTIYHLAGGSSVGASISQPHVDFSRTVTGTEQLLDWMRVNTPQCRLIAVSSAAVYGSHHSGPSQKPLTSVRCPLMANISGLEQLCQIML
jgi:UDP-glucose 4-epimerase